MSYDFVNKNSGLSMLNGNKKIYAMLLKKYHDGDLYTKCVESVASGDMSAAQTALHTLKGATGNLHLTALHEKSKELEHTVKMGAMMPTAEEMASLEAVQNETIAQIAAIMANPSLLD